MLDDLILLLTDAVLASLVISVLVFLMNWKKLLPVMHYLGYFLILNLIIEIAARVFQNYGINNLPLLHLYTLGEFMLFSLFYRVLILQDPWLNKWFWPFVIIISSLIILNSLFIQSIYEFNSIAKTLVQTILIGYSIIYFNMILQGDRIIKKVKKVLVWVNSSVLIYYAGSLLIFMFSNYFLRNGIRIHVGFWALNAFLNLIFQVTVLIVLWKLLKNKKSFF